MVNDSDTFDSNPYRSPEWPSEPMAADSELLTKPIHLKGTLSLDEVLRAHGFSQGIVGYITAYVFLGLSLLILGFASLLVATSNEVFSVIFFSVVGLMVLWAALMQFLIPHWLKPLWQKQRSVFAYREVTITDEVIETKSTHGTVQTPWTDYASYRRKRNIIWLHLNPKGLKKRREQGGMEKRQSRFGVNLQKIDIFPRLQFENDAEWERFRKVVKHRLLRAWPG